MTISRVLLHNHSTWSDGHMSLPGIAKLGEKLGATAVVMSEHDYFFTTLRWDEYVLACKQASTVKCAIIPGIEYSSADDDFHILSVGTPRFYGARRDLVETLSEIRSEGGATVFAHPSRRDCFRKVTPELLDQLDAVEIWNRKTDGLLPVKSYFRFARARGLATTVGMDLHSWRQVFPIWNEMHHESDVVDGRVVASSLRRRAVTPACIAGQLTEECFASDRSTLLTILSAAEKCRRVVRDFARSHAT